MTPRKLSGYSRADACSTGLHGQMASDVDHSCSCFPACDSGVPFTSLYVPDFNRLAKAETQAFEVYHLCKRMEGTSGQILEACYAKRSPIYSVQSIIFTNSDCASASVDINRGGTDSIL